MSEPQKKRRQFLADVLFAGGALGAAALGTRYLMTPRAAPKEQPTPAPTATKKPPASPTPVPEAPTRGRVISQPTPAPALDGDVYIAPTPKASPK